MMLFIAKRVHGGLVLDGRANRVEIAPTREVWPGVRTPERWAAFTLDDSGGIADIALSDDFRTLYDQARVWARDTQRFGAFAGKPDDPEPECTCNCPGGYCDCGPGAAGNPSIWER